jgi:hypothetical protein
MPRFQPSFSFWPRPQFLGGSKDGLEAWLIERDAVVADPDNQLREDTIRQIIDEHHDRNSRTIHAGRPDHV